VFLVGVPGCRTTATDVELPRTCDLARHHFCGIKPEIDIDPFGQKNPKKMIRSRNPTRKDVGKECKWPAAPKRSTSAENQISPNKTWGFTSILQ